MSNIGRTQDTTWSSTSKRYWKCEWK